uniref:Protein flightless-1 homolog (inferred by orthology to a C. elegans protein) n=1 Tax=Strongyloides venezuelensis TaxID=75913 RepID=A0A0K0FBY9_STRVS
MSTGVLQFVKGFDLSRNDFSSDKFPPELEQMTQATWLKLNRTKLERVPDELSRMPNLEHLQMSRNNLTNVHGELSDLPRLRSVIVHHNNIKVSGIPSDIFRMKDLTIIDFSHNQLKEVPANLEYAKCAIVLNLSHNNITSIPPMIFSNMIDLIHLDISNNKLDQIPSQIRRLQLLQILNLSNNSLKSFHFKLNSSMKNLRILSLKNTNRTFNNLSLISDECYNITDLDLSYNSLTTPPDGLYDLKKLRKLDLSYNKIEAFTIPENTLEHLEVINLSGNEMGSLPENITKLSKLQRIYASFNKLTFSGLPPSIGKLLQLKILFLSYNQLELIPEGLCRCVKLVKLKLDNNNLITLPDTIYLLPDLKELDLHNNDNLVMPPKPSERSKIQYYNVDFSAAAQAHAVHTTTAASSLNSVMTGTSSQKDPVARKKDFIKRRRHQADVKDASKVIQGMSKIAGKRNDSVDDSEDMSLGGNGGIKAISWKEKIEQYKPKIDYSEVFDDEVGSYEDLWIWEIENFYPVLIDPSFYGQFYEADSYLVLKTNKEPSGQLTHQIFYWIGEKTSLDKGMCAAVHAVNLRNYLGASCRTIREEMNDESEEFLSIFTDEIIYIEGARTTSGFYNVEKPPWTNRLYRGSVNGTSVNLEPVPCTPDSLDPRFVYLLDAYKTIWIWSGYKSRTTVSNKVRLFAVTINSRERKGEAEIETCNQYKTPEQFWKDLYGSYDPPEEPIVENVLIDQEETRKKLYHIQLGMGFLEIPQIELKDNICEQSMLETKGVYVLDTYSEVFLWIGKKANRLTKMAGHKIAKEIHSIFERPEYAQITKELEGEESCVFRSKFKGWNDIVPADFTRTAESMQRRGADLKIIMERDKIKTDLNAFFAPRASEVPHEEADAVIDECNEDLEFIESFVLENRKFVKLPPSEFGTFYTCDCYVFLCRYFVYNEDEEETEYDDEESDNNSVASSHTSQQANDFKCVVYFWQGRDAGNMGWLHFTFSLQKKFESLFKDKLEVIRMYQQQENAKFLSHFHRKFLIRRGRRNLSQNLGGKWPELYSMRANGSAVCTRTIQIDCLAKNLNSGFCFILRAPFSVPDDDGNCGKLFVWKGSKSDPYFHKYIEQVARELINATNPFPIEIIDEGNETPEFWKALGGKKKYETDASFVNFTRLFRCSNDKGYFAVSEKTMDFCQDDLDDEDIMVLDNGEIVYLWIGNNASQVETKLAYGAVGVYIAQAQMRNPERPRKLMAAIKGLESKRFTKCFHAWGKHKVPAGD